MSVVDHLVAVLHHDLVVRPGDKGRGDVGQARDGDVGFVGREHPTAVETRGAEAGPCARQGQQRGRAVNKVGQRRLHAPRSRAVLVAMVPGANPQTMTV